MNFISALSECGKSYILYSFRTLTHYSVLRISHFFEKMGFSEKLTIFERIASKMIELLNPRMYKEKKFNQRQF